MLERVLERVKWRPGGWPGRLFVAGVEASRGYSRHGSSQFAAAISYRVLFSLVPLVALIVSIVDLVMPESMRQDITDWLLSAVPGPDELDQSVERAVSGAGHLGIPHRTDRADRPALGGQRHDGLDPRRLSRHLGR